MNTRLWLRLVLNALTLAGLLILLAPEPAEAAVSCVGRPNGSYSSSENIMQYKDCPNPPPYSTYCKIGVTYCTWTCQNQTAINVQCNPQFCLGQYGNVICCDGSCQ